MNISEKNNTQIVVSGDYRAEISNNTMFSAVITASYKNKKKKFNFTALTDTLETAFTFINLSYPTTLFNKWFSKSVVEKNAEKSLENLKDYMTDTRRFYGFEISMVPVEDTAFLFSRITVPQNQRREATKKIFEKLLAYAEKRNAGYNGTRIYHTLKSGNEITIFASIGVTNAIDIPENSDIEYKRMPFGKNLLVANYQGPFGESDRVYKALELFKTDHSMTSMAIPFQKFLSDGYDFADDQIVQLKVYYPVF
jgi:effector-binding domain-containing protein